MDYNFYECVLWFFSSAWLIKIVGLVMLALSLFVIVLKFR